MHTRASNSELVEPLPEPERTLNRRLHRRNRRVPYDQRNNPPQHPRIVYPPILTSITSVLFNILRDYVQWMIEPIVGEGGMPTVEITQKVLNATAGGIFLYKTPNQAYQLLEDKVLLKLDWAKNQKTKSSLKKTVAFADGGSSNSDTNKIMARMDAMTLKMDAQYKEL
ncbi:hypothetical protein Tco_0962670 [Tanacetum coccineum]